MARPLVLFQNFALVENKNDRARPITFTQDWIGLMIEVTEVSGDTPEVTFKLQWSNDGEAPWFDSVPIVSFTAPGQIIRSMPIEACFWRLRAVVSGTSPSFTCSAHAVA